jgi:hypothetical protein
MYYYNVGATGTNRGLAVEDGGIMMERNEYKMYIET